MLLYQRKRYVIISKKKICYYIREKYMLLYQRKKYVLMLLCLKKRNYYVLKKMIYYVLKKEVIMS